MSLLIANCPRCGSKSITFQILGQVHTDTEYGWQKFYELFCQCRACQRTTIFVVHPTTETPREVRDSEGGPIRLKIAINSFYQVARYISLRDQITRKLPENLPDDIANAFKEGATCMA